VAEMRVGILTISEKWKHSVKGSISHLTQDYLQAKYPLVTSHTNMMINGGLCPSPRLCEAISSLKKGQALVTGELVLAAVVDAGDVSRINELARTLSPVEYKGEFLKIRFPWDIFKNNGAAIESDYELLTRGRVSQPLGETNRALGADRIFIEEGAVVQFATLNASTGPIYIGKDAEVMEGSIVRGPFALCDQSVLKMACKIYGPTTIGPGSKVGGEINNSVLWGNSNKAHDGFLGNSVLGEWCNLGADTNNSNLKNNYEEVKLWSYTSGRFVKTGLQFCGLVMGDHSKCGINTMFNTGTVVGVSANIFGDGFPRNFIPSFAWGGAAGFQVYTLPKAFEVARKVLDRQGLQLSPVDEAILTRVFEHDQQWRNF